jgi:hypothetical protein
MSMSNSQYTAGAMVDRIDRYEPPYDRIIKPGLYALEEAMTILLQSEEPDFDAFTTAAGVLEAQSAFWHACSNEHLLSLRD